MTTLRPFSASELRSRLDKVRYRMDERQLDGLLISVPENIYYLTGLDHWGYFAAHLLVVPRDGELVLIARAMERVTIENHVGNARFVGYADDAEPALTVCRALAEVGLEDGRMAMEMSSLFLTPRLAAAVQAETPRADWSDASGLVDDIRQVKSDREMAYTRQAAAAADAGMLAAIEAIHDGVSDWEVAAACHAGMIAAGSEYPGFGPFIRPTSRLGEEHTTWRGDSFHNGDAVFLELAGSCRRYQAPMGRLVYVGTPPRGVEASVALAGQGMAAICEAIRPGATAGDAYAAWQEVARAHGLIGYERHHCGYLVGIGFPPSWTGGSSVTGLAPNSGRRLEAGMTFHVHSWFTNTDCVDYFISNTVLLTEQGCEMLTSRTPETLIVR